MAVRGYLGRTGAPRLPVDNGCSHRAPPMHRGPPGVGCRGLSGLKALGMVWSARHVTAASWALAASRRTVLAMPNQPIRQFLNGPICEPRAAFNNYTRSIFCRRGILLMISFFLQLSGPSLR